MVFQGDNPEYFIEGNEDILKQYDAYRVIAPGVNLAVDTRMDNSRDWFELVDDKGNRLVRAANYVQELKEHDSAHFENAVVSPDGSVSLDAVAHSVSPDGEVETSEVAHHVEFSAGELTAMRESEARRLATDTAMFLADKLNSIGIRTEVVSQEQARGVLEENPGGAEFSVADIQKLNYEWNGEQISMKVFAQTFGDLIKQKDRTMEDVERIAEAYIDSVKENPSAFIPQLKAENMSHWRYFVLPDGSVYSPQHLMANSPEYQTQRGLYVIYRDVLGERLPLFMDSVSRYSFLSEAERGAFLEMEREVSGSDLMQRTLETNAEKVNERRNRDISNLIQYFNENTDYTSAEKALILKGAMTYSYSEKKKDGGRNEVKLVRITDANDVSVPVLGGDAATIAEGLRKGLNFKDSLILARNSVDDSRSRSVARDYTGWKVYAKSDREEDAVILQKDAAGTGWCTGGAVSTARTHLSGGDFHIYFENGEPLIAIRTEDGRLAEAPRGAHEGQFCTLREEEIAFSYIQEGHGITGGKEYVADMQDLRMLNSPDCTWRDMMMMPAKRRYENGEFGGDTESWGKAAEEKIRRIMNDSRKERFAAGYYTPQEIAETGVGRDKVVGILNDTEFVLTGEWPNLEFLRGDIAVTGKTMLPNCQSVGGRVTVSANASLNLPNCQSVGGHVDVYENASLDLPNCQSVGGYVDVVENASLNLPNCQSVGGSVDVRENASLDLPSCQSVGGGVDVRENASLDLPNCQSVGGFVDVHKNASLTIPPSVWSSGQDFHLFNGAVYGYERGNTIYLTPEGINPNTPIHEYAHLWAKAMQKTNPEQWNGIKVTLKTLPAWNEIAGREDYTFLRNDEDRLAGEVLATVVGDRSEDMLVRAAGDALNEGQKNIEDVVARLGQTVGRYVTEDLFGLKEQRELNVETLTLGVMKSLVEQKDIISITEKESTVGKTSMENLVRNDDGTPKLLWHGSSKDFDKFDFSHAGENTDLVEYPDKRTGEKVTENENDLVLGLIDVKANTSFIFDELNNLVQEGQVDGLDLEDIVCKVGFYCGVKGYSSSELDVFLHNSGMGDKSLCLEAARSYSDGKAQMFGPEEEKTVQMYGKGRVI